MLQTFADQAVIAIENTRLFNETKEALERQTATADILKVIASSPSDVQPVFDAIVERAVQLCGATMGRVYRFDGELIHMVGGHGLTVPGRDSVQRPFPRAASEDTIVGRVMLSRRPNILADLHEDDSVPPLSRQMIEAIGARSQVTMPMLLAGQPIGAITLSWAEPRGYTEQQIGLLQTFADQAVIAVENTRLFNDVKEALERQTATSDILKVIASSPSDTTPVFEAIAGSAEPAARWLLHRGIPLPRRHCSSHGLHADQSGRRRTAQDVIPAADRGVRTVPAGPAWQAHSDPRHRSRSRVRRSRKSRSGAVSAACCSCP